MSDPYLWLKWLHIVSVISWMVGLLYLPRLFVYHVECGLVSEQAKTFKVMERRLYKGIMTPAMIASWIFGLGLIWVRGTEWGDETWLLLKLALLLGLMLFHGYLGKTVKGFAVDQNDHSVRYFRLINEVPTLIMLAVVFFVVFKPF